MAKKNESVIDANVAKLNPSLGVLVKLASIAVHVDEMLSPDGHDFDKVAIGTLINDAEVVAFLKTMGPLIPQKRNTSRRKPV